MKFKQLPLVAKIAIVLTFYNTWVMFEEFVIDRFGYWQYLPFYNKGIFCTWDIGVLLIAVFLIFGFRTYFKQKCFSINCVVCKSQ